MAAAGNIHGCRILLTYDEMDINYDSTETRDELVKRVREAMNATKDRLEQGSVEMKENPASTLNPEI